MENKFSGRLVGWETHGFLTMEDLDVPSIMKEAKSRWLRPNEIHAMLSNYTFFSILVKPVNLPKGGTIVLFDRKKLRNFRKDGLNWKKKKDGKTVKEAHEHLKVGTEEKIHVYYAHGEDNPNLVRRCYWLLDKTLEHIVLVHYRELQQEGSPATPLSSEFSSDLSDPSASRIFAKGLDHQTNQMFNNALKEQIEATGSINVVNHEMRLHEINTLEWDELLASNPNEATLPAKESTPHTQQYEERAAVYNQEENGTNFVTSQFQADMPNPGNYVNQCGTGLSLSNCQDVSQSMHFQIDLKEGNQIHDPGTTGASGLLYETVKNGLQWQDSFGKWMNDVIVDSPGSVEDPYIESSVATSHGSFMSSEAASKEQSVPKQIFCITHVSPSWACSTEQTKILVVGFFNQEYQHLAKSNVFCVCGDTCVPAEVVQLGVFQCLVSPHSPGLVKFYLSFDCCTPISQVLTLKFRSLGFTKVEAREHQPQRDMFWIQMRLAHLLFSTPKRLDILTSKISQNALKAGKKFASEHLNIADSWTHFTKLVENGEIPLEQARNSMIELALKSKLKEWLLERIFDRSKISERDAHGQGVLHLCAILDYTWVVYPYSVSGLSLDFRDKIGWTSLHWAAYFGREKMVATLLSAGAKPNLVTDPTSENPGGCTASDLAFKQGFEGLAAYLSEKALVQQFEDMKLAGNVGGSLETPSFENPNPNPNNASEDEIYLKDTLAAYRTAASAAARIHVAFRDHSFKQKTKAVEGSNPEDEARYIIAAMKIQHAYRNYGTRQKLAAAARIQYRFRTWKLRKEFLNARRQAIKIQAIFRGYQVRRQYRKIIWSVGILEKALLRWRKKKKGLRGLQVDINEPPADQGQENDAEEDFYRASRKQAEVRVESAVVRVQSMFRSRKAQQEYRRMKLAHMEAELEYGVSMNAGCCPRNM